MSWSDPQVPITSMNCKKCDPDVEITSAWLFIIFDLYLSSAKMCMCRMEFGNEERPECNNLLSIYQQVTGKTQQVYDTVSFYNLWLTVISYFSNLSFYLKDSSHSKEVPPFDLSARFLDGPRNDHCSALIFMDSYLWLSMYASFYSIKNLFRLMLCRK
jgi:hypothetical protein